MVRRSARYVISTGVPRSGSQWRNLGADAGIPQSEPRSLGFAIVRIAPLGMTVREDR